MNPFSERHVRAVESVRNLWPGERFVIVGGLAVAHHTGMPWRVTRDMDVAIAIQVEEFPGPLLKMESWGPDPEGREHRRVFEESLFVDFLPVGSALDGDKTITWPESQQEMTVVGFRLAFEHATEVTIGAGTRACVADLPAVILLKMIAFAESPADRSRDLHDMVSVIMWNEEAAGDRLFDERLVDLDLQVDEAAAFLMGEDVGALADDSYFRKIDEFFEVANQGHLGLLPMRFGFDQEVVPRLWGAFKAGIEAARGLGPGASRG